MDKGENICKEDGFLFAVYLEAHPCKKTPEHKKEEEDGPDGLKALGDELRGSEDGLLSLGVDVLEERFLERGVGGCIGAFADLFVEGGGGRHILRGENKGGVGVGGA